MAYASVLELPKQSPARRGRPALKSFDSGYEHSPEHWMVVRKMVEEADQPDQPVTPAWLYALGVKG
ncbi:MAG: hypothetical protein H0X25_11845 [Acidobacteriales bacterium]|nr:hypothetical protein [Terriglobales bacterium]